MKADEFRDQLRHWPDVDRDVMGDKASETGLPALSFLCDPQVSQIDKLLETLTPRGEEEQLVSPSAEHTVDDLDSNHGDLNASSQHSNEEHVQAAEEEQPAPTSTKHTIVDVDMRNGNTNAPTPNGHEGQERCTGDYNEVNNQRPSQSSTSVKQYFLCCKGLENNDVVEMLVAVSHDLEAGDDQVELLCPLSKRAFLKNMSGPTEVPIGDVLFGHRLFTHMKLFVGNGTASFRTTKSLLESFAKVISTLQEVYGTGIQNLFDLMKPGSRIEGTVAGTQGDAGTLCSALQYLETEVVKRMKEWRKSEARSQEHNLWTIASRKETLNEARRQAGITGKSFEISDVKMGCKSKPPVAVFHRSSIYKVLWHNGGRTIIKNESRIKFTGSGVKVSRASVLMWLALLIGLSIVVAYVILRRDETNTEDLIQTALAILALYAATVIPFVYYTCYNEENLLDVVRGEMHLDKRAEFDALTEEEKLYVCLESLKKPDSDRGFIDDHNASYVTGSKTGGAMRLKLLPAVANLLAVGCKYCENGDRKGLILPTGTLLELKDKEYYEHLDSERPISSTETILDLLRLTDRKEESSERILQAQEIEKERRADWKVQKECPLEEYYVA